MDRQLVRNGMSARDLTCVDRSLPAVSHGERDRSIDAAPLTYGFHSMCARDFFAVNGDAMQLGGAVIGTAPPVSCLDPDRAPAVICPVRAPCTGVRIRTYTIS